MGYRSLRNPALAAMLLACAGCGAERHVTLDPVPASGGVVRLEVVVTGLRGTRGMVRGALFASASGFPDEHERAARRAEAPAREGTLLVFEHVPQGDYALAVLHDEDGNGRLARNLLGIPREGYALSGAPVGLPRYDAAVIRLTPPLCRLELRMTYWGQ